MRSKRTTSLSTRTKVHIFTGGIKEDVAQIELKGGELLEGVNYQEIDGLYHGYSSLPGYEVYDGTDLASTVALGILKDYGLDKTTGLLIECDTLEPTDKSHLRHPIVNSGVAVDTVNYKFFAQSYYINNSFMTVNPVDDSLDIGSRDYVIDLLLRPAVVTGTSLIFEKENSYKLEIVNGYLVFSVSTDGVSYTDTLTSTGTIATNNRYHVSISKYDDVFYLFLDGFLDLNILTIPTVFDNASPLVIGGNYEGNIEEIRFTFGIAHHFDDFVIPVMPYSYRHYYDYQIDDTTREAYRDTITALPGTGPTLGVAVFDGDVYGVRLADTLTESYLYRATPTGWDAMTNSLNPGGSYRWNIGQYAALTGLQRVRTLFWTSGTDFPKYLNGDVVTDITHASLPDNAGTSFYANNLIEFKNRLFLAYPDGRLLFSAVENPLDFSVVGGAGEIYMEDEITDLVVGPGDSLLVFCKNSTFIIKALADMDTSTGIVSAYKFHKTTFSKQTGAFAGTCQRIMGTILSMSDKGITNLEVTDAFGDFTAGYISKNIQRTLMKFKDSITATIVHRVNNQYRVFFEGGGGLIFTFDVEKKVKGVTKMKYPITINCISEGNDEYGDLKIAFGSGDGFVYLMDSGTSFNGEDIETKIVTAYDSYASPSQWKRFRKISLELKADRDFEMFGRITFDYGEPGVPRASQEEFISEGEGGIWGTDRWGAFTYGSAVTQNPTLYTSGYGKNMSISLASNDKYRSPHVVNAAIVEYTNVGQVM